MSVTRTNCPSCGAEITFSLGSSIVVVCSHCKSAIARTDRNLAYLGKVAALVETQSPLRVGLRGTYESVSFYLSGRAQLQHAAGGVWDEWYAAFSDGRTGWLAEAQGRFYMTFAAPIKQAPTFDSLVLGQSTTAVPEDFVVAEKGTAKYAGAEGEIPFRLVPGEDFDFADLSGASDRFATLDYSEDEPRYYFGRIATLHELGLDHIDVHAPGAPEKRVGSVRIGCPKCGGSLELHAPDQAQRVGCPYCGSLLDATQGTLKFLQALTVAKYQPYLPLGSHVEFEGTQLTIIGFVVRSCRIEGIKYFWREYLLYAASIGFRWLVHSDGHWTYARAVPTGNVRHKGVHVEFRGKLYKRFQHAAGVVEYVSGEFYWKVAVGETVDMSDYVCPPMMLSSEISEGEINWSLSEYVSVDEMHKKFPKLTFAHPHVVGACEPCHYPKLNKSWAAIIGIALLLIAIHVFTAGQRQIFSQTVQFTPAQGVDATQTYFSEPIEITSRRNIHVTATAPLDNAWLSLDGDFINEETGLVQTFDIPLEYYHGVEDGESWSEGSPEGDVYLSALPAGKYTLRLEAQWYNWKQPQSAVVTVHQDVPRLLNPFLLLLVVSILPLAMLIAAAHFETCRWRESMYSAD